MKEKQQLSVRELVANFPQVPGIPLESCKWKSITFERTFSRQSFLEAANKKSQSKPTNSQFSVWCSFVWHGVLLPGFGFWTMNFIFPFGGAHFLQRSKQNNFVLRMWRKHLHIFERIFSCFTFRFWIQFFFELKEENTSVVGFRIKLFFLGGVVFPLEHSVYGFRSDNFCF